MTRVACLVLVAVCGCRQLLGLDEPVPATAGDAAIDGNPLGLTVDAVWPHDIDEGQGAGFSRPAIVVVHGSNFAAGATVTLMSSVSSLVVSTDQIVVASSGDYIAAPVEARIDPSLQENDMISITVVVSQIAGGVTVSKMLAGQLVLHGHDELTASNLPSDPAMLQPLYSSVTLAGNGAITYAAGPRIAIRSASSITIGDVIATGHPGSGATAGAGGPGGCNGGGVATAGECQGAGAGGTSSGVLASGGGGGGAGFATTGGNGSGSGAGPGGSVVGDDMISSYAANVPAGGGGGGTGTLNGGGGGGGGGGTIELSAGGNLQVGNLDVSGGAGGAQGSGGGGGAGGVIVLRAGVSIATGTLTATGGAGGMATSAGGIGSAGRIRWNAPNGGPAAAAPAAIRAPGFVDTTPFTLATRSLAVAGAPDRGFDVSWTDAAGSHVDAAEQGVAFGSDGTATITPPLSIGWNRVCATIAGASSSAPEATTCIDVAYLP